MFGKKTKKHNNEEFKSSLNTEVNFDGYTQSWDQELDSIRLSSKKNLNNVTTNPKVLGDEDFDALAKSEYKKIANNEIYFENNEAFVDSVKNQIFAETARLLGNDYATVSHDVFPELDEKYSTGDAADDQMIRVATAEDKELLKMFDDANGENYSKYKKLEAEFQGNKNEYDAFVTKMHRMEENDPTGVLSEQDKAKIKGYSRYAENIDESLSKPENANEQEWKQYRDDIANYAQAKTLEEIPTYKMHEEFINNNSLHVEAMKEVEPDHEIQSILDNKDRLLKTNDTTRPSIKEQAPFVPSEQRVTNVKNLEDTDWEKIKDYVKDFNTNTTSVAIANVPLIVDADNALRVDLNEKFYLSQAELSKLRDKQAKEFQSIIDDYEETLKKHEDKALQQIYEEINNKPEVRVNKAELQKKQEEQNTANLKVIDENLKLKKQIKELEEKLNQPAPVPVVKPKMAKFEMEEQIEVIAPEKKAPPVIKTLAEKQAEANAAPANEPTAQAEPVKKPQIGGKITLKSLAPNNGSQGMPKKSGFMSMNHPASAMSQRNQPTTSLIRGNTTKKDLFANTLSNNRQASVGPAQHGQENIETPMEQPMRINLNQVKKQANEDTHFVGPDDEINKIVSLKDALGKNKK